MQESSSGSGSRFPKHHLGLTPPDPGGRARLRGWRNTLGNLIGICWLKRPITHCVRRTGLEQSTEDVKTAEDSEDVFTKESPEDVETAEDVKTKTAYID